MTNTIRLFSAAALIAVMILGAIPAWAADLPVAGQVTKLSQGENVKVRLNSGKILKGRLGPIAADQFTLEPRGSSGTARVIKFSEARSVKTDGGLSTGAKVAITAGAIGGGFLLFLAFIGSRV